MSELSDLRAIAQGIDLDESYSAIIRKGANKRSAVSQQTIHVRYGTKEEQARDGVEPKHGPRVKMKLTKKSNFVTLQVPASAFNDTTVAANKAELNKLNAHKDSVKDALSFIYDNQHIIAALWFVEEINVYRSEISNAEVAKVAEIIRTLLDRRREQIDPSNLRTKPMTEKELEIAKKGLRAYVYQELHPETAGSGEIYLYPLSFSKAAKRKL